MVRTIAKRIKCATKIKMLYKFKIRINMLLPSSLFIGDGIMINL